MYNTLSANRTKWSNKLKKFVGFCWRIVSVFAHFVGLALKGLNNIQWLKLIMPADINYLLFLTSFSTVRVTHISPKLHFI